MCTLQTGLTVQNGPWPITLLAEDAALLCMRPALGMECLTIYPLNIGVNLKKHRLPQMSSKISLIFPSSLIKFADFAQNFNFLWLFPDRKVFLIFQVFSSVGNPDLSLTFTPHQMMVRYQSNLLTITIYFKTGNSSLMSWLLIKTIGIFCFLKTVDRGVGSKRQLI